jgi:hypothetical protein
MPDLTVSSAVDTLMQAANQAGLRTACGLGNSATLDTGTTAGTVATGDHTHAASAITSGTFDAARLPAPGTTTLGGVKRNTGSAGQYVNGIDTDGSLLYGTPSGGGGSSISAVELSSDWTTTNNSSLQDITGLSFSMAANTSYLVQAYVIYTTSASATGSEIGASGPASPTRVNLQGYTANTAAAESNAVVSAFGTIIANANGSTSDRPARVMGIVRNGANAGTFQLQAKVETGISGTLTIKTGTALAYTTVTV